MPSERDPPASNGAPGEVTRLLAAWSSGEESALDALIPLVYEELRRLAERQLSRERAGHTLQPTAVVHEAFLRLVDQRSATWKNRGQFFAVAAQTMRRLLVDHARRHGATKRGATVTRVPLEDADAATPPRDADVLALDQALGRLARLDATQAKIVELRYFAGLTLEETAEVLGASRATVVRAFRLARAYLHRELFAA